MDFIKISIFIKIFSEIILQLRGQKKNIWKWKWSSQIPDTRDRSNNPHV